MEPRELVAVRELPKLAEGHSKQGLGRPGPRPHGRNMPRCRVNWRQPVWLAPNEGEGKEVRDKSKVEVSWEM